jgi:hypothetical protein
MEKNPHISWALSLPGIVTDSFSKGLKHFRQWLGFTKCTAS